ncbi:MAG: PAS domain-containing protein [Rhodospirillaceae bacterium]|jgi:PAS domain S-box-containing protein|nr:PAS domain-containing protein [Rhodospirillaceae bacterium]MBT5663765.1 PAS domain-containing protein [Rhodospirillaceae bacterium]
MTDKKSSPEPGDNRSREALIEELEELRSSERQLRAVIDNCPVPIFLKDIEGRYLLANSEFKKWYNQTGEKITDSSVERVLSAEKAKSARERDRGILESGRSNEMALDWVFPDGVSRSTIGTKFPVRDETDDIIGVGGVRIDVTALRSAEAALENVQRGLEQRVEDRTRELQESESLLRSIFDNAPAQVNLKGRDERYMRVNEAFASARNVTPDEIVGTYSHELSIPDHARNATSQHRRVLETGETIIEERKTFSRTGKPYHALITKFPVFDAEGNVTSVGTFSTDIHALKEAEAAMRRALNKARDADQAKQDFLANVSHELRTPLNAIIGFSDVLQLEFYGSLGDKRYIEYAEHISQSGHHLLALVNDILDLSKIEAGKLELSFDDIDIDAIASAATLELKEQMQKKSLHFTMEVDREAALIRADGMAVRRILTNLLSNAVKFTPENGHISLAVDLATPDSVDIVVSDTGIGVPPSDIQKILTPFGQSGDMVLAREGGTGLGLPIVNSLVKLHDGTLDIESDVGAGTKVRITLPRTGRD